MKVYIVTGKQLVAKLDRLHDQTIPHAKDTLHYIAEHTQLNGIKIIKNGYIKLELFINDATSPILYEYNIC